MDKKLSYDFESSKTNFLLKIAINLIKKNLSWKRMKKFLKLLIALIVVF